MAASTANANSGPASAPAVSIARCTPKLRPRSAGSDAVAISASRGPVLSPLPRRSTAITAAMLEKPVTKSRPTRDIADATYPTKATRLGRFVESDHQPPRIRTAADTPW